MPLCQESRGVVVVATEQQAAGTVRQRGHGAQNALGNVVAELCQGLGELQPFLAVIIAVAEEVLGQKHPQLGAQLAREQQADQQGAAGGEKAHLQHAAPGATEVLDKVADHRHAEQVQPGAHEGDRVKDHVPRHVQVHAPLGIAGDGDGQPGRHQRGDQAAGLPQHGVELAEQQGLGIHEEVVGVDGAQGEAQKLYRPALTV